MSRTAIAVVTLLACVCALLAEGVEDETVIRVLREHGAFEGIQFYSAIDSPPEGLLERCGTIVYDAYDKEWRCEDNRPRSPYE